MTSDGRAAPGQEVRILDEHGDEVPRGTEGDIAFRGASNLLEYIGQPAASAEMFTGDGFSKSGDLGVMDADGYVRVTGRIKDIVIRGGLNISVRQVEDLLIAHPAVSAVAAVGMPDAVLGERVCCYLVPAPGTAPLMVARENPRSAAPRRSATAGWACSAPPAGSLRPGRRSSRPPRTWAGKRRRGSASTSGAAWTPWLTAGGQSSGTSMAVRSSTSEIASVYFCR